VGLPCWPGYGRTLLRVLPEGLSGRAICLPIGSRADWPCQRDSTRVGDNLFLGSRRAAGLLVMQCISWPEAALPHHMEQKCRLTLKDRRCTSPESQWSRAGSEQREIEKRCYSTRSKCIWYKTRSAKETGKTKKKMLGAPRKIRRSSSLLLAEQPD
jgi:hypothetical protein